MKEFKDSVSGKLPLKRERPPVVETYRVAEPLPLTTDQIEEVKSYLVFIQSLLDRHGKRDSENSISLVGFGGFSFKSVTTKVADGVSETEFSVWYHPKRTEPMNGYQLTSVMDVIFEGERFKDQEWRKGKEFHLYAGALWQKELRMLIDDSDDAELEFKKRNKVINTPQSLPVNHPAIESKRTTEGLAWRQRLKLDKTG